MVHVVVSSMIVIMATLSLSNTSFVSRNHTVVVMTIGMEMMLLVDKIGVFHCRGILIREWSEVLTFFCIMFVSQHLVCGVGDFSARCLTRSRLICVAGVIGMVVAVVRMIMTVIRMAMAVIRMVMALVRMVMTVIRMIMTSIRMVMAVIGMVTTVIRMVPAVIRVVIGMLIVVTLMLCAAILVTIS